MYLCHRSGIVCSIRIGCVAAASWPTMLHGLCGVLQMVTSGTLKDCNVATWKAVHGEDCAGIASSALKHQIYVARTMAYVGVASPSCCVAHNDNW